MRRLLLLLVFLCLAPLGAQELGLSSPGFRLELEEGAKLISRQERAIRTRMVVEKDGVQARITWSENEAYILFPDAYLKVQRVFDSTGSRLKIFFNGERYEVREQKREIAWIVPEHEIYFRTRAGRVSQAVGTTDFLKLRRDTPGGRLVLESNAGNTNAELNESGLLETEDGPEISEHLYFVRGLAIKRGPISLILPLPADPFIDGLPADRYLTFDKNPAPVAEAEEDVDAPEEDSQNPEPRNPLEADPATWGSPQLQARPGEKDADPLHFRKENRVEHKRDPLQALPTENSEDVLRVKDY